MTIDRMHPTLARLLRLAHEATATHARPVQTLQQLREHLDISPQLLNAWKSRGVSKQGAIDASRRLGCTVNAILDEPSPYWMHAHPPKDGAQSRGLVAQEASPRPYMVAPMLEWEQIMSTQTLPHEFEVTLPDDAMAPVAPSGTKVRFSTQRQAKPGDAVLVRDGTGRLYFREYHVGLGDEWHARPTNPFFPSLASIANELTVVAVFVAIERPWSMLQR